MTSEEERLEEIEEDIQEAKRKATDDGLIEGGHHGHRFFESGDEPESKREDDQTIAPPG